MLGKLVFGLKRCVAQRKCYRVIELNYRAQEVLCQIGGRWAVKLKLDEVVNSPKILQGLQVKEACWLGIYYGRFLRASQEGRAALKRVKAKGFPLTDSKQGYRLIAQNRDGSLGYVDLNTRQEFTEQPFALVGNEYALEKFSPAQACYIGILAGIDYEKTDGSNASDVILPEVRPVLRLVN